MADEYIRKQEAIDIVVFECGKWTGLAKEISKQLKQLSAANVVPVVHGRWIDDGTEFGCQCSECGKSLDDYVAPTEYASLNEIPNFCPNCGARMDKE